MRTFKLDGHEPVPCTTAEWSAWFESAVEERIVRQTDLRPGHDVVSYFVVATRTAPTSRAAARSSRGSRAGVPRPWDDEGSEPVNALRPPPNTYPKCLGPICGRCSKCHRCWRPTFWPRRRA